MHILIFSPNTWITKGWVYTSKANINLSFIFVELFSCMLNSKYTLNFLSLKFKRSHRGNSWINFKNMTSASQQLMAKRYIILFINNRILICHPIWCIIRFCHCKTKLANIHSDASHYTGKVFKCVAVAVSKILHLDHKRFSW